MSDGGGRRVATALAMLAALLAGVALFRTFGPDGSPSGSPSANQTSNPPSSSAALRRGPAGVSGGGDPIGLPDAASRPIPKYLPDFALATEAGPPRSLASFKHPSLVVNFWATWCAPCRREIPLLQTLRRDRREDGVEVVGIAVDFREAVLKYAREIGLDYPLLIGEQDGLAAAQAFGMDMVLPFTVFADAQRRIVALKVGELHADEAAYILDLVAEVNAGRLELAPAQTAIAAKLRVLAANRANPPTESASPPGT